MGDQDLLDLIAQADPDTLQQIFSGALGPERMAAMNNQPMAQGRDVGHTYVASSPLEHLANAFRGYQQQQLVSKQGQSRQAYMKMLAGKVGPDAGMISDGVIPSPQAVTGNLGE